MCDLSRIIIISQFNLSFTVFFSLSLILSTVISLLVVSVDVAIHTLTFTIIWPVRVIARGGITGRLSAVQVVAVVAHAFGVMRHVRVLTVGDCFFGAAAVVLLLFRCRFDFFGGLTHIIFKTLHSCSLTRTLYSCI